jgi:phosphatidate cytidylyltransferase
MSLLRRFLTAVVLLGLLVAVLEWAPALVFFVLLQVFVIAGLVEFYGLARRRKIDARRAPGIVFALLLELPWVVRGLRPGMVLLAGLLGLAVYYLLTVRSVEAVMAFPASIAVTVLGALYVGFTMGYLYGLRAVYGSPILYFFFIVIILSDSGAMLFGKLLGRHKMVPFASPHKTWEGAAGGLLFAAAGAVAAGVLFLKGVAWPSAALAGFFMSLVAQVSDPIESLFKRAAGVKDSSSLLPGHGGFLDRLDSYLLAAPFFYYYLEFFWT